MMLPLTVGSQAINKVCELTYKSIYKTSNNIHLHIFQLRQVLSKVNTTHSEPTANYTKYEMVTTEAGIMKAPKIP